MHRTRSFGIGLLVVSGFLLVPAGQASAGGWDSLSPRRDHYLIGETAVVAGQFAANHLKGSGRIQDGPYYGYLMVGSKDFGMIDPPVIPPLAIRLGAISFSEPVVRDGDWLYSVGRLSFTVPDVPSGDYAIGICNEPCTEGTVGWLGFGRVRIVHTALEGELMQQLGDLRSGYRSLKYRGSKAERETTKRLEAAKETKAALLAKIADLSAGSLPVPAKPADARPLVAGWAVVLLAAALLVLAAGLIVASRRRREAVIDVPLSPDDVDGVPEMPEDALRRG